MNKTKNKLNPPSELKAILQYLQWSSVTNLLDAELRCNGRRLRRRHFLATSKNHLRNFFNFNWKPFWIQNTFIKISGWWSEQPLFVTEHRVRYLLSCATCDFGTVLINQQTINIFRCRCKVGDNNIVHNI